VDPFTLIVLFIFGLAIGSFLNVVALRYDGDHFLLDSKMIGGRSHCTHCGQTLRWFELVPLFSFIIQGGRCRRCKATLSIRYPIVELLSGIIFVAVPFYMGITGAAPWALYVIIAVWIAVFEAFLLMALIDIQLGIIPDEVNIFLLIAGVFLAIFSFVYLGAANHSFLGPYAGVFGLQENVLWNRSVGALFSAAFFWLLTKYKGGQGMGMGDLKLAIPLGLLFGWPDVLCVFVFAFILGAAFGLISIALKHNNIKGTVPFGPFLAIGSAIVFFWGGWLFNWYFSVFGLR
jgi:prepilin signal peptidase PulO-like enzyme (type II secretory pathway)